jgi:hypothetical protein
VERRRAFESWRIKHQGIIDGFGVGHWRVMEVTDPLAFLGIATLVFLIYGFFVVGPATHGLTPTERERVVKLVFRGLNGRAPGWPDELVHLAIALFAQIVAIYAILAPERIAEQTGALSDLPR